MKNSLNVVNLIKRYMAVYIYIFGYGGIITNDEITYPSVMAHTGILEVREYARDRNYP